MIGCKRVESFDLKPHSVIHLVWARLDISLAPPKSRGPYRVKAACASELVPHG